MSISTRIVKTVPSSLAALLVMAVLWMPTPASASRHAAGWTEYCPYVMTTHDDPIFFHGQPGAAAAHDFFGNMHTDANSTYASLRAAGADTSCLANPYDDSAYWTPTLLMSGKPVQAKTMFQYYWAPPGNLPSQVEPTPSGLKMYGNRFFWTCGGGGSLGPDGGVKAPRKKVPFDCTPWPGSRVTAVVFLPNCWDGVNLDSGDHMSHMAYPDPHTGCPNDHSHVLAGLYLGINWYLTNGTGATLSTGDISTMRAMFFDAWDPAEMARLIGACMNNDKWCGAWTHSGLNRPPVIKSAQMLPAFVHETDTPSAIAVNAHDPDGDPFTLHYQWQANGQDVGTDGSTLDYHLFAPGDVLTVTITAVDDHGNWSLPVTSKPATVSYDVVAPKPTKPGGVLVNVHGGGFGPTESVPLHLDSQSGAVLATVTTDVLGMFPDTNIQLPQNISGGTHWLYGVGSKSQVVGNGPFSVGSMGDLSPTALAVGDPATFTGSGYVPGETVTLSFPNQAPQQVVADGQGAVDASLVAPSEPGPGQALTVSSSNYTYDLPYHVVPTMSLPTSGEPGVAMPFSLTGFGPNEKVEVFVDDVDSGQSRVADATGAVSGQITLSTTFGAHQVKFTGLTTGVSTSSHVSLPAYVTLTPTSGAAGTSVTVSSRFGWPHGESVMFSWDKVNIGGVTADGSGSVTTTFVVPAHKPGKVVATLTDTQLGASPSADFTVTGYDQVENSPPSIQAVLIDGTPFTNSYFAGVAHGVKDPDGDPVTLHYTWMVNGKKVGNDVRIFSSTYLKAGDVLDLWIQPEDNHGNWGDKVEANNTITLKWEVDATPARPTESSHPVDLSNFTPFENVDIHMDSPTGKLLNTIPVNNNGNAFNQQVPIPWPLPGGAHVLYAVGQKSGIVGQGPLSISAIAFAVPGLLHVGDPTVISASGFRPGENVTASFPHTRGVSAVADGTGTVAIDMTMPEEPFPGGDITVSAPSGTTTTPFKVWSSLTFNTNIAEPQDKVPFSLHGYGPSETVEGSIDGTVVQTYTTNPDGSLDATLLMDAPFGRHRIVMTGLASAQQHNWKINLALYVLVTPNPAHPSDTLTITSLYGWAKSGDTVYLYWGKNVVQALTPDAQGSIRTTFVIPGTQKPGIVSLKLLDTVFGKYAICKVTIVS